MLSFSRRAMKFPGIRFLEAEMKTKNVGKPSSILTRQRAAIRAGSSEPHRQHGRTLAAMGRATPGDNRMSVVERTVTSGTPAGLFVHPKRNRVEWPADRVTALVETN